MIINKYFKLDYKGKMPRRVFARSVDYEPKGYEIFDAVDAQAIESAALEARNLFDPKVYGQHIQKLPIYSIEVHAEQLHETIDEPKFVEPWSFDADIWLENYEQRGPWVELSLTPDSSGPAELFDNISADGQRAQISARDLDPLLSLALERATGLDRFITQEADIESALPTNILNGVVVLDVGQGSAAALIDDHEQVTAYIDIGAGITRDAHTWPSTMPGFCLEHDPPVILTHWHADHFQGANKFQSARSMTWIAPNQRLGPGPQTAMANAISAQGKLLVWNGSGTLRQGQLALERCTGPATNQNRCGIAVWIEPPQVGDAAMNIKLAGQGYPILLPGDAGYGDIPSLSAQQPLAVHSLAVSHHGGTVVGRPPSRQPGANHPRAAISYGRGNGYKHPLSRSLAGLRTQGWSIGHSSTVKDDRRTEQRIGSPQLGHIGLDWGLRQLRVKCKCKADVTPRQF